MATLGDKRAVVTGAASEPGRGLERALRDGGASVLGLADAAYENRAGAEAAFAAAQQELGGPLDVVVHTAMPAVAYEPVDFATVDDARWHAVWEVAMRSALFVLQAAHGQMSGRGGSVVMVTPTVAMSGAARLVPYTTAVEGQRLLAKAAARQWGPDGIRVNCLAPAPEHVPIGVDSMSVSLAAPALGGPGDVEADLGPVVVWLASDAAHFVTGATVCADGGVWMAP
ncbi:MAG TPA: SDR family oxidoreductase [Acidimicrobiia bacterium]|jgi:3-oxoacyl-[acyl-carrier protein] reductase